MLKKLSLFFLIFIFSNQLLFAKQTHFKVSYDPNYAPFSYIKNNKEQGLLIDYWKLWAKKNNYTVEFVNGKTWQQAIRLAKYKSVDFFIGGNPYEDWMKASQVFYKTNTSLFSRQNDNISYNTTSKVKVGIIGKDYTENVLKVLPFAQIEIYKDYEPVIEDLLSKKIDLLYDDKIAVEFYALQNSYFYQIKSKDFLTEYTSKCAISRDSKLIDIFNEGLENIPKRELEALKQKWIINQNFDFFKEKKYDLKLTKEEEDFLKTHTITIASSEKWKPFNFKISDNLAGGISAEIWGIIAHRLDIRYKHYFYDTFTMQLNAIKTKQKDIIISTGLTKNREEYSMFTSEYISFPLSIVTSKNENFIENISYLFDKTVAVGKNFTAHKMIKEKYPNIKLLLVNSIEEGLEAVEDKKAYAFIDIKPVLTYNIKKLGFDDLKISANTNLDFKLRIMIRDDYLPLKSALNKAILSLEPHEIDSIIQKWENIQFEKSVDYQKLWLIISVVIVIFVLLVINSNYATKRAKKLEKMVNERTIELMHLNETLEQRVKQKTKELVEANVLLDEAQEIAELGSYQYNIHSKELKWSDELFKIFEILPNRATPSKELLLKLVHKDDKDYVKKELETALSTPLKHTFEFKVFVKGEIKFLQSTSKASRVDEFDKPLTILGTVLDLTKIKTLENEKREQDYVLAQQSKMAAMGEMLENIAHQWRQPLSIISTAATGIQVQQELVGKVNDDFLLENITSINKQAQYLSKTIDDFRNFFNPNKVKGYFKVETCVEKTLYLINSKINSNFIKVIKDIDDYEIHTLENEIIQVLLNLISNAVDALKASEIEDKLIFIKTKKENDNIIIEVLDNAGGIHKKILNRVFEPYFTTKHKSQGTGIGLYMSREITTKHLDGELNVTNKSYIYDNINYKGAKFKLTLPL